MFRLTRAATPCSTLRFTGLIFLLMGGPAAAQTGRVDVTLTEGTNIAAALSPDGSTLVIDLQGRLWRLPAAGGDATPITDEFGDARQPAWAPDGSRIAFQSFRDGNWHIWTVRPDGTDLRQHSFGPFDDREPHWSPDGAQIAFSSDRSGNYDIWTLDVQSGAVAQFTTHSANDYGPTWAPGGDAIAFASSREPGGIWVRHLFQDGERLIAATRGTPSSPAWSPDGARLAFQLLGNGAALLVGPATGGEPSPLSVDEDVFPSRPAWQSAGSVLYTADGKIKRRVVAAGGTGVGGRVETIEFRARLAFERPPYVRRRRDFESPGPHPVRGVHAPAVSPAGDRVALIALGDLWIAPVQGGEPRRVTNDPFVEADPAWSPDGATLLFVSDRAGTMDLWVLDLVTGSQRRVTTLPGAEVLPAWSPDGSRVAFHTVLGLEGDLRVMDLRTGETRVVRDDLFAPSRPTWSPDGSLLALSALRRYSTRFREGRNEILLHALDGKPDRYVTPVPHRGVGTRGLDGPVWSPDGSKMAFTHDGLLWTVAVSADGTASGPPVRWSSEPADAISWTGDSRALVYQSPDGLRRVSLDDGRVQAIPLALTWTRPAPSGRVTIHAGRLFDGKAERPAANVDIVIEGRRIREVTPHRDVLHTGEIVDASNRTVIPGLFDVHAHLGYGYGEVLGRTWLAYGVTSIRDPSSEGFAVLERRESVESGRRAGPREFATGRIFDGTRIYYADANSLVGGAQLQAEIDRAGTLGFDLIKTYVRFPDLLQKRVIDDAHRLGIPVSSHEIYPAVAFGADHVEHIRGTSRRGYSPKVSETNRTYADVIQLLRASGMTLTPTIGISGGFAVALIREPGILDDPRVRALMPPALVDDTRQNLRRFGTDLRNIEARIAPMRETVRRVIRVGGRVIAGTDAPIVPYGLSLILELESFVDGGLSPVEALRTATSVAAEALGAGHDLGSIEAGKLADLVILDGDPLRNIRDVRNVRVVVKDGRVHTVEELLRGPR